MIRLQSPLQIASVRRVCIAIVPTSMLHVMHLRSWLEFAMRRARDYHWSSRGEGWCCPYAAQRSAPLTSPKSPQFSVANLSALYHPSFVSRRRQFSSILPFFANDCSRRTRAVSSTTMATALAFTFPRCFTLTFPRSEHVLHHLAVTSMQDGFACRGAPRRSSCCARSIRSTSTAWTRTARSSSSAAPSRAARAHH
jgi:hypothetical protein